MSLHPADVFVVETDPALRTALRAHFGSLGGRLRVAASAAEARDLACYAARALVIARNERAAQGAAELACGIEPRGDGSVRLVLMAMSLAALAGRAALAGYIHDLDLAVALTTLPPLRSEPVDAGLALGPDFPHDLFRPLARVGRLEHAAIFLAANRLTQRKELVVQVEDADEAAPPLVDVLYAEVARGAVPGAALRHEVGRCHSYLSSRALPLDLAGKVRETARGAPPRLGRAA